MRAAGCPSATRSSRRARTPGSASSAARARSRPTPRAAPSRRPGARRRDRRRAPTPGAAQTPSTRPAGCRPAAARSRLSAPPSVVYRIGAPAYKTRLIDPAEAANGPVCVQRACVCMLAPRDDGRTMARGNSAGSQTTKATLGLRELVFSGEIAPGDRLPEVELAERLGVSRTPLRMALQTLAHEGLLEALSGGGFVVRAFSRSDVSDAIELRGVLEGTAARFAAERLADPGVVAPLVDAATALDEVVRNIGN